MTLYVESSAILAWVLGDSIGDEVLGLLDADTDVVASELTFIECERALIRGWSLGILSETDRVDKSSVLAQTSSRWIRIALGADVLERTRRPFPIEPVRALDALHLASALTARSADPTLRILTLDQRIRENGQRLGFEVVP